MVAQAFGNYDAGRLLVDSSMGACLLVMWGLAAFLIGGRGIGIINGHPGSSERERRTGDDERQSRAIGVLLLVLSLFLVVQWLVMR